MSQAVVLDENDVPGAKLKHPDIEKNTVPELRRWLLCRSIKCSGVKTDLVKRVQDVINTGITEIDPKIDGGKWYFLKKQQLTSLASNHLIIPVFPKEGKYYFEKTLFSRF
ncbi:dynein beta chain, flagellar outer arm [Plakobranchus ocellatus]|uniref:Dynein beta chain, flagellar outer arm n=1 Tax=Plakobranchus ocellatus TaxID=259542 RepID=A0AAV4D5S0_9GAST|nr:dynein beta chain, flagellar outer arm [Plakobranchus ocellatus]